MFNKRIPSCVGMEALVKITTPTVIGAVIIAVTKLPDIINTVAKLQKSVAVMKEVYETAQQQFQSKNVDFEEEVIDME